jgi:hypothetical protein
MQRCCEKVPLKMIISYKNPILSAWEAVPMILSLYNALIIPLYFSFALPFDFLRVNDTVDILVDVLFLVDNSLLFFTSF